MNLHAIRDRLVDSPDSVGARFRRRRWEMIQAEFPDLANMSVVDLGGEAETWRRAPVQPKQVCVVNLVVPPGSPVIEGVEVVEGNACDLPESVTSRTFDVVFSNSVLEHVGGHLNRVAFAASVERLAPYHWVQTPYRYFPIEPHYLFPLFQHLPAATRGAVARRWQLVHSPSADPRDALAGVLEVELVSQTELRYYFPDSRLLRERVGPFIKSIIAVKSARSG
jgi:hypothetical protein